MVRDGAHERVRFARAASLPGTEVKAVYHSTRRWHGFNERYAFVVHRKAASSVRYRGQDQRLYDGTLVIREPGEVHHYTSIAKPAEFKVLFVEAPIVADAARQLGHRTTLHFAPLPIRNDPHLFRHIWKLCRSVEEGGSALYQQSLFETALYKLAQHAEQPAEPIELRNGKLAVARAKAYLIERCSESVSLHDLAAVAGLSRFGLVHAFSKEVGLSPHAYQVHVRVEQARGLLKNGVSPATVATTMGFADQSHFTRHFKRIMQVTPSQYAGRPFTVAQPEGRARPSRLMAAMARLFPLLSLMVPVLCADP
jgi:AraC-like DNA-binding protein